MKNFRRFDSIKKIKQVLFSFKVISEEEVKNAVKDLPIKTQFLVIFQSKFLTSMLLSTPKIWQVFLMNL